MKENKRTTIQRRREFLEQALISRFSKNKCDNSRTENFESTKTSDEHIGSYTEYLIIRVIKKRCFRQKNFEYSIDLLDPNALATKSVMKNLRMKTKSF